MSFEDRVYVVLGASGGIGSAVARHLASGGARLVCSARNEERLNALTAAIGADAFPIDATKSQQVDAVVEQAMTLYGRLDGAVNCVGSLLLKPAHLTTDAEWRETLAKSLDSAFYLLRATAKRLMKDGGSIVFVSTAAARVGLANHEAIAAAKAGVVGLTLSAAATYASKGIRVNCVAPGLVETPLTAKITSNEKTRATSTSMHALGRLGQPDDVARAITWLLDPEQSWVTGQTIGIDGGLGTVRPR